MVDAGLSGEGEWGENASVLKLPPFLGGDVPGDYAESRASGGAYAGARHERGALLYEASLRLDLATGDVLQANPHVGVVWRPGSGSTRLRASVGRASKLPSFFALGSPPALGGNPALQPEHAWGGEAGVEHRFAPARLDVGAAYFRQEYSNLVDFDFDRFLHVNRARVRTQGVEMTARWQPHATVWLDAEATWLDVQDLETGGTLLHTPGWTGGGRLTWQPSPALSLRVQARATAGYLDVQFPVPDRDSVDGYGLARRGGFLALRPRPVGPRPRRQPHRHVLRDLHRLPRPRPRVLGRPGLGPLARASSEGAKPGREASGETSHRLGLSERGIDKSIASRQPFGECGPEAIR